MTNKTAAKWIPQPLGVGYVTTVAELSLETSAGLALEASTTLLALSTGPTSTTGKYPTVWASTGA